MKEILKFNFTGNSENREDFLCNIKGKLIPFVNPHIFHWNGFMMLVMEMIKNIYDHADGIGHAYFEKDEEVINFDIKDYGEKSYDYEQLSKGGWTKKSKWNYGVGLPAIPSMAQALEIDLQIDTSKGFSYKGAWKYK